MYIVDGIAYAGEKSLPIRVWGVRALKDFRLWVRFNTGEQKIFDCKQLLDSPAFTPISDPSVFQGVYLDYGVTVWNDGDIDIAPETLYEQGVKTDGMVSA